MSGVETLKLSESEIRDTEFSLTVFKQYQWNGKALIALILEIYISSDSTRKVSKMVEELCDKSVSSPLSLV